MVERRGVDGQKAGCAVAKGACSLRLVLRQLGRRGVGRHRKIRSHQDSHAQ